MSVTSLDNAESARLQLEWLGWRTEITRVDQRGEPTTRFRAAHGDGSVISYDIAPGSPELRLLPERGRPPWTVLLRHALQGQMWEVKCPECDGRDLHRARRADNLGVVVRCHDCGDSRDLDRTNFLVGWRAQ